MQNNILEVKNLSKIYHDKKSETLALNNITFNVKDKEFISIVGPSGCGKSTILGILANIMNKSDGNITFNKKNPVIGYMLQQDALFPWKTVYENCILGLEIKGIDTKENKDRVLNLLNTYGLKDFIDKYPDSLSGGMRQRVACIL